MMASQLGRMILDASEASADEMTAKPDTTGRYGQMDGFLADLADRTCGTTGRNPRAHHVRDDASVFAAMRAGARGYLVKGANQDEILRAVRAVASGEAIFGPGIAQRLIDYFSAAAPDLTQGAFPELTDREREVLELIAQGLSNPVIAQRLSIAAKTVRNHVSNIFTKLQVADRAQAIVRAREAGMGGTGGVHRS